jgi:hypothetical protein
MAAPATPSVYEMVRNRLPFLEDSPSNETLIGQFKVEACWELENCFKVRFDPAIVPPVADNTRVADEVNYTPLQLSIVADLVSVYILLLTIATNAQGLNGTAPPPVTYLKTAKAGSAEVDYDQFDVNKSLRLMIKPHELLAMYKSGAIRKAMQLNCLFDFTDATTLAFFDAQTLTTPFIIHTDDCFGCGS